MRVSQFLERTMAKSLLSLVLVATQTISCGACPLYLCVGEDGSLCVDFGPDSCDCCQHVPGASLQEARDQAAAHGNSAVHNYGLLGTRHSQDAEPCGCTHIQISAPQTATLERASAAMADGTSVSLVAIG